MPASASGGGETSVSNLDEATAVIDNAIGRARARIWVRVKTRARAGTQTRVSIRFGVKFKSRLISLPF